MIFKQHVQARQGLVRSKPLERINREDANRSTFVVEHLNQRSIRAAVSDLAEGPHHNRIDVPVMQQVQQSRDRTSIPQIAKQVRGIIAVGQNLLVCMIMAVTGNALALSLRSIGSIAKDI